MQIATRRGMLKPNLKKDHKAFKYVGINSLEFRKYIESKFVNGMSWDNFGVKWQLGHIVAVEMFDHFNEKELKLCWHYKNFFPIESTDNRVFGSCLLFAKMYFEHYSREDYSELLKFVYYKLPTYTKYLN